MISPSSIQYLSFEGGGGKGIVYLGAIKALQKIFNEPSVDTPPGFVEISAAPPLIHISHPPEKRQIKGVSGSSIGAVIAFMLAMGMASDEIEEELNRIEEMALGETSLFKGRSKVSPFEKFFEDPDIFESRKVSLENRTKDHENLWWILGVIAPLFTALKKPIDIFIKLRGNISTFVKKILFTEPHSIPYKIYKYIPGAPKFAIYPSMYFHSLLFNRGLFPGLEVRNYFEKLVTDYLFPKIKNLKMKMPRNKTKASEITFLDFFFMTGVDLVVTGVNVSQRLPLYFSVRHTPDFPVTEAVAISMNFPFIFKPIYVDYKVKKEESDEYNKKYKGLFVDGGMLNNFPIHAFDVLDYQQLPYQDYEKPDIYPNGANDPSSNTELSDKVVGFRLTSREDVVTDEEKIFEAGSPLLLFNYAGDIIQTLLYPSEDGQIRSPVEKEKTIALDATGISLLDFASIKINELRKERETVKLKNELINAAEIKVTQFFTE